MVEIQEVQRELLVSQPTSRQVFGEPMHVSPQIQVLEHLLSATAVVRVVGFLDVGLLLEEIVLRSNPGRLDNS
jgi:predicted DNA-binding transcriptional regulator